MSNASKLSAASVVTVASLALNIFLVAFVLGHNPPPPPPMIHADMLPPPDGVPPHPGGPGGPHHHPFMPPSALFTPEELQADQAFMKEHFDKAHKLRQDFAAELEQGNVTTDMISDHFKQVDAVTAELKAHFHQKLIEKIQKMTPDEQKQFARQMAEY